MPSEAEAVAALRENGFDGPIALAIVTGTGLGALVEEGRVAHAVLDPAMDTGGA